MFKLDIIFNNIIVMYGASTAGMNYILVSCEQGHPQQQLIAYHPVSSTART